MLAEKIVTLTEGSGLLMLSYFCRTVWQDQFNRTVGHIIAIALLYALIRQLVKVLLPQFDTSLDLSEERFESLDGSLDTWNMGLSLLRHLISLLSRTTFCTIDGLGRTGWMTKELRQLLSNSLSVCVMTE